MKCIICVYFLIFLFQSGICSFINRRATFMSRCCSNVSSEPLFLTPYIESNQVKLGQQLAEVKGLFAGVKSYAGFLTVNKTYNSNLYFWFFPAEVSPQTAPVILWLQGGPGSSSLYGLFEENGPFYFLKNGTLRRRDYYWSQYLNVIYIDNPVGTGYSFTEKEEGYATDEIRVGEDLYSALNQFLDLFPDLRENNFFVSGESYAGKYVPSVAYTIHQKNQINNKTINLKGIAIGNGYSDPENMVNYSDYLYMIGLIDSNTKLAFKKVENEIVEDIKQENYHDAFVKMDTLLDGDLTPYKSMFYNSTGFSFYFNFLQNKEVNDHGVPEDLVQRDDIRSKINVGNLTFHTGKEVEQHLENDIMKSVKPWVETLVENYRVLFYNGQLDIIVAYPLTVNFLRSMEWSGAELYASAERKKWYVGNDLAGYSKTVKNLTEVIVRNAGHMVPHDQPLWALDLITRFVFNKKI